MLKTRLKFGKFLWYNWATSGFSQALFTVPNKQIVKIWYKIHKNKKKLKPTNPMNVFLLFCP